MTHVRDRHDRRRTHGRRLMGLGLVGLVAMTAMALVDPPHGRAPDNWRADAALVLSGDVDFLRVRRAARLFHAGAVSYVIVTGGGVGGDDGRKLAAAARRAGVPEARLLMETESSSTYENLALAAPLLRRHGFRRVALVTSASHLGRAERVAHKVLPEVQWIPVSVKDAGPMGRDCRNRFFEWLKLLYYGARGWI